jgi:hypothetical protein
MKWRFKEGALRIRISPEDKQSLMAHQNLQLEVLENFKFLLKTEDIRNFGLVKNNESFSIICPKDIVMEWLLSEELSLSSDMSGLELLIEKDLSCSHSSAPLDKKKHFGHKFE